MKAEQFFRHSLTISLYPSECVAAIFSSATYSLLQYLSVYHPYSVIHISFPVLTNASPAVHTLQEKLTSTAEPSKTSVLLALSLSKTPEHRELCEAPPADHSSHERVKAGHMPGMQT